MSERVHNSPNLIYSAGTQVVTRKPVQGSSGQVVHPASAVGVIVKSPQDRSHAYRVLSTSSRWPAIPLRTQFERIIRRAGAKPWPKLFQNMRASRETELAAQYPLHVVCAWIGNSPAVAKAHYLQVTEADFAKAVQNPVQSVQITSQSGAVSKGGPVQEIAEKPAFYRVSKASQAPPRGVEPLLPD